MKKLIVFLLLVSNISFAQKKDYKNLDRALKYNSNGKLEKSIKYANKALKNTPDWNEPILLLASIYVKKKQIKHAANYLLKVYNEDNPNDKKGIEQIAKLYYSYGFYNEALYYFIKTIALDTVNSISKNNLHRYLKNCEFAIKAVKNPVDFNPVNLGSNINSENEEYLPAISVDGNILVYSRRFMKNNILQEDFFISKKNSDNLWAKSIYYGDNLNTNGNEGAFSFSAIHDMAVFTSCDRYDGLGRCDLYLLVDGTTYNAGKNINSKEWDSQGCFSPDGKYLYFVSNRKGGYGGKDIWRSEITNNGFLEPQNLGGLINTKYDEMSPFLHPDNLTLYFGSNGHIGMGDDDIYLSRRKNSLDEWGPPQNLGYPINTHNTENSLIVDNDGITAYYTSNESGFGLEDIFSFYLPKSMQADKISTLELDIITNKIGDEVVLNNVTFPSNSSKIDSSSYAELNKLIAYLTKNPDIEIEIQGHTDNVGSYNDNLVLSEKRARAVYDYLITKVLNKLSYVGYGELRQLVPNDSDSLRSLNRRTSFVIQ